MELLRWKANREDPFTDGSVETGFTPVAQTTQSPTQVSGSDDIVSSEGPTSNIDSTGDREEELEASVNDGADGSEQPNDENNKDQDSSA